jgi:ADP-ribosylglycohydrolase
MHLPDDYVTRVYAGVLGKLIGVYLGRPFEGWTHERILAELGEVNYYVHEELGKPLIVTDDDISGTFTFLRALTDEVPPAGEAPGLPLPEPARIGQAWLNYLIEGRTVLWWGGMGNSTEHTAYLRLKSGYPAPHSGSIALNGKVVAEQIGAQIFIDGWAMVAPGDPQLAADLARRAASVSHDGEAVYGAQVLAAMEAQAFVESDADGLLDTAVALIPPDSILYRMIADVREWHARSSDWRATRALIEAHYGYDKYGGNCHMVPNHALIVLGLLYGQGDFQRSLMIANTSGWDTDCNSGNLGCLMGIRGGLAGIDLGPDWRGPLADRLYLPTADGGRAITDAVAETFRIVNAGRALAGLPPLAPKGGARFHFDLPGALQGFQPEDAPETRRTASVRNARGHSAAGDYSLAIDYRHTAPGCPARVSTPTFIPPAAAQMPGYTFMASPTIYPGQVLNARLSADESNRGPVPCRLYLRSYGAGDQLGRTYGPQALFPPGTAQELTWEIPDCGGSPIAEVGVEIEAPSGSAGTLYLDYLTWQGEPQVVFARPAHGGRMWQRAWVDGVDHYEVRAPEAYRLIQNRGTGLLIQGTRQWRDVQVSAALRPHLVASGGIAARVQGMQRYYALLLCRGDHIRLVKALDGQTVLAEADFPWEFGETHALRLQVAGPHLRALVDDRLYFDLEDDDRPLLEGAVALVVEEGRLETEAVAVSPIP